MSTTTKLRATLTGAILLPVLALALSGCTGGSPSQAVPPAMSSESPNADGSGDAADGAQIVAMGLHYSPTDLTVPVGTTVRWVNQEAITHTVTSGSWGEVNESTGLRGTQTPDGKYDHTLSPKGQDGDTFEFTFTEPGTYQYFCRPHQSMFGTITVT
jgi:plastocyanin